MIPEFLTNASFRLATLTLEVVDRRKVSLDSAFHLSLMKMHRPISGEEKRAGYLLARKALMHFAEADFLLSLRGVNSLPPRRRAAFRAAYVLAAFGPEARAISRIRGGLLSTRLLQMLKTSEMGSLKERIEELEMPHRLSIKYSTPPWIVEQLLGNFSGREVERILESMCRRRVWIRINELKTSVDRMIGILRRKGIKFRLDEHFPFVVEIPESSRTGIQDVADKYAGSIVFQDKGSVVVALSLDPEPYENLLDMAAAPGMKTSVIQQLTCNGSRVLAIDISTSRISAMKKLMDKLNVANVDMVCSDSTLFQTLHRFDKVLIDAPCTNSGALSSDPALRLILWNKPSLGRFYAIQHAMILRALEVVRRGGVIVYSTCSLAAEEGEKHFEDVRLLQKAKLDPSGIIIGSKGYQRCRVREHVRRLWPHRHGTTGFFIARIVRR